MIAELLSRAAAGRGALLSRRELRGYEQVDVEDLKNNLRDMTQHAEDCRGKGSTEIFGDADPGDLGHAPAWIDAGAVYEDLIDCIQARGPLDYVFCLDPWSAQLRSRAAEIAGNARWILVSDLERRREDTRKEYWEQLGEWFGSLSYAEIHRAEALENEPADIAAPVATASESELHARKPGSWEWRRVPSAEAPCPLLLLVRYSGSLAHLKTFLDSLTRLEGDRDALRLALLTGEGGEDPRAYLKWIALAHPKLQVTLLTTSGAWQAELRRLLDQTADAPVAMVGDHAILPPTFLSLMEGGARSAALGLPLGVEATAHILTGNLDPIPNYETLRGRVSVDPAQLKECARFLSPAVLRQDGADPVERLMQLTRQEADRSHPPLFFLELADLP